MPLERLNGIELYYESHGDGPVVTWLHGGGGNHISWWQQVPAFRDRYRCITIDHRGFGSSTDTQREGSARYGEDLEALLEKLGIDRSAIVAQSMGGRTAMDFATRHPERVSALIMCDTWGYFDWPELEARIVRPAELLQVGDGTPTTGGTSPQYRVAHPEGLFLYQQIAGLNPPRDRTFGTSQVPKTAVASLPIPVLFLVGSEDPLFTPEIIRTVHELIPGSEYVVLEGCGHSGYFEDASAFNAVVARFLAAHAG